jgi:hypothetical protein
MRYELTDYERAAIKPFLPSEPRGVPLRLWILLGARVLITHPGWDGFIHRAERAARGAAPTVDTLRSLRP